MKKIVITTSPRYEADLIESFCRHSLRFADMILVNVGVDHTDNTLEILHALKREGLNLEFYDPRGMPLEQCPLDMVRQAFTQYGADLVLPFDPDEFLFHVDGLNPRDELEKTPEDKQTLFEWETFVYSKEPDDDKRILSSYFHERRQLEPHPTFKTSIHKNFFFKHKPDLVEGRHKFIMAGTELSLPSQPSEKLRLAHYPLRGIGQAMSKVLTGRLYYISRRYSDKHGFQWIDIYESIKKTGSISREEMRSFSLYYGVRPEDRDKFTLKNEVLPVKYAAEPELKYTSYAQSNSHERILKDILVRTEEIVRYLIAQKEEYNHFFNWIKIRNYLVKTVTKIKRSIIKRTRKTG